MAHGARRVFFCTHMGRAAGGYIPAHRGQAAAGSRACRSRPPSRARRSTPTREPAAPDQPSRNRPVPMQARQGGSPVPAQMRQRGSRAAVQMWVAAMTGASPPSRRCPPSASRRALSLLPTWPEHAASKSRHDPAPSHICARTGHTACHICSKTGLTPAHICARTGQTACHICSKTGLTLHRGLWSSAERSASHRRALGWWIPGVGNRVQCHGGG